MSRVRRTFPPPVRCSDTAARTGQPCQRWAVPWSDPARCRRHGGTEPATPSTPTEPDPVAERISTLEARPTARRMTEAVRLRQIQERAHGLTLHGQPDAPPALPPPAAPPPEPVQPGRRTTRLGSRPGGQINILGG